MKRSKKQSGIRAVISFDKLLKDKFLELDEDDLTEEEIVKVIKSAILKNAKSLEGFLIERSGKYASTYTIDFGEEKCFAHSLIMSEASISNVIHSDMLKIHTEIKNSIRELRGSNSYKLSPVHDQASMEREVVSNFFHDLDRTYISQWTYNDYTQSYDMVQDIWGTKAHLELAAKIQDLKFSQIETIFEIFDDAKNGEIGKMINPDRYCYREAVRAITTNLVQRGIVPTKQRDSLAKKLKLGEIRSLLNSKKIDSKGKKEELLKRLAPGLMEVDFSQYMSLRDYFSLKTDKFSEDEWIKLARIYSFTVSNAQAMEDYFYYKIENIA